MLEWILGNDKEITWSDYKIKIKGAATFFRGAA